jgi:hypothetical protein
MRILLIILFISVPSIFSHLYAGAKTDTITLYNGDKITCEIKQLSLGMLKVKTSDMGTLNIKWYKISNIETNQVLEIVLKDRTKIYGLVNKTDSSGYVRISSGFMIEGVYPMMHIVSIDQIAKNFWQGLDGSVSYGFSYAKGSNNLQSNFALTVKYRTNHLLNNLSLNSIISNNAEKSSTKQDATYSIYYYFAKRSFIGIAVSWQQNTELGIKNRLIGGIYAGYIAAESNFNLLKFYVGPLINWEETSDNSATQDLEIQVKGSYSLNLFANPKVSIDADATIFPSITDWGRFRSDINTQISWEIFNDFTLALSYYFNSDNRENSTAAPTDWGATTSIKYTF